LIVNGKVITTPATDLVREGLSVRMTEGKGKQIHPPVIMITAGLKGQIMVTEIICQTEGCNRNDSQLNNRRNNLTGDLNKGKDRNSKQKGGWNRNGSQHSNRSNNQQDNLKEEVMVIMAAKEIVVPINRKGRSKRKEEMSSHNNNPSNSHQGKLKEEVMEAMETVEVMAADKAAGEKTGEEDGFKY
jgi:hypothetical protein